MRKIRKLAVCLFVHDVSKRNEWFMATVESILKQRSVEGWVIRWYALTDSATSVETKEYLKGHGFSIIEAGESQLAKFQMAMEMSEDYVAIAHDDDPWMPEKLQHLLPFVDESEVVVSAYTTRHEDGRGNTYECPVRFYDKEWLTYCVMGGWILKTGLQYDAGSEDWYGIEQRLLASLNQRYSITISIRPTFQYTEHVDRISDNRDGQAEMWQNSIAYMDSIPSHKKIFKAYYDLSGDLLKWRYM